MIKIVGAMVIIGAVSAGIYLYTQNSNLELTDNKVFTGSQQENTLNSDGIQSPKNVTQPTTGQANSLAELAQGGAKRCDVTIKLASEHSSFGDYSGTFYSDGQGKYKSEIWQQSKPTSKFFTLVSNPWVYTWTNQDSRGVKTEVVGANNSSVKPSEFNPNEFDQPYNFDCSDWRVDSAIFIPPANITFSDLPKFTQ